MRALVACVVASVSVISGAALLRIWWIREATKRRWKAAKIIIVDEEDFNEKKQILFRGGKSALQVGQDQMRRSSPRPVIAPGFVGHHGFRLHHNWAVPREWGYGI